MKIAVVTDDGQTVSQHFGRARHYQVFDVAENVIVSTELRDKAAPHHQGHHHHSHDDAAADDRHRQMISAIPDCQVVLVRGMGRRAFMAMEEVGMEVIVTDIAMVEEAVRAYLDGTIENHIDRLH